MPPLGVNSSSSSSSTKPWGPQQPYLKRGWGAASGQVLNRPLTYYPGQTTPGFSGETEAGLSGTMQTAMRGDPNMQMASDANQYFMSGDFMREGDPHLDRMAEARLRPALRTFKQSVMPGTSLAAAGRGASGAESNRMDRAQDMFGRNVMESTDQLYGNAYFQGRQMQQAAISQAPGLQAASYVPFQAMRDVGQAREQMSGAQMQDLMRRHEFAQTEPGTRISNYMNLIGQPVMESNASSSSFGASVAWG